MFLGVVVMVVVVVVVVTGLIVMCYARGQAWSTSVASIEIAAERARFPSTAGRRRGGNIAVGMADLVRRRVKDGKWFRG